MAFIEPGRYDRILKMLDDENAEFRRGRERARDARQGVPRSRTIWPGQRMYCGICGRVLYYGAHGQASRLMCKGAIEYRCWNSVSADGPEASRRICQSVMDVIQELPEFDEVLISEVRQQLQELNTSLRSRIREKEQQTARHDREIENILKFIRQGIASDALGLELRRLEAAKSRLAIELDEPRQTMQSDIDLPSASEIRERGIELFSSMAPDTPEFGRLMNHFVENLVVHPVRPVDGGKPGLRAHFSVIRPNGQVRAIFDDSVDFRAVGRISIQRGSYVEPNADGRWTADLSIVDGPVLGPYDKRNDALAAEVAWLGANWLLRQTH